MADTSSRTDRPAAESQRPGSCGGEDELLCVAEWQRSSPLWLSCRAAGQEMKLLAALPRARLPPLDAAGDQHENVVAAGGLGWAWGGWLVSGGGGGGEEKHYRNASRAEAHNMRVAVRVRSVSTACCFVATHCLRAPGPASRVLARSLHSCPPPTAAAFLSTLPLIVLIALQLLSSAFPLQCGCLRMYPNMYA